MKYLKIIIFLSLIFNINKCFCAEIIVDNFNDLVNASYSSGDIVTFAQSFTSEGNIGNLFPDINNITFEGNNYVINGKREFSGFIVNSSADFNRLDLSNCKGQSSSNLSYGGGIFNDGGNVHVSYAALSNNFADARGLNFSYGGAIYSTNGGYTNIDTVLFQNNSTSGGLATGGAVSNGASRNSNADMEITNSIFRNNQSFASVNSEGGALYNNGNLTITKTSFISNSSNGDDGAFLLGGAIYNSGNINIDDVRFLDNTAGDGGAVFANGGAIYNTGVMNINNSTIDGNTVASSGVSEGGAIYNNTGATLFIKNSVLQNNSTMDSLAAEGGAINNNGNLFIENSIFKDNFQENYTKNDIYNNSSANLEFTGDGVTGIYSGIAGSGKISKTGSGTLDIGGENNNFTGDFIFEEGRINLLAQSSYFDAVNTTFGNNVNFNMRNKEINSINFGNLTLNGRTNLTADMNLNTGIMDYISADSLNGSGEIYVSNLDIEGTPKQEYLSIPFANSVLKNSVVYNQESINTPIYKYNLAYNSANGNFEMNRGGFNPGIFSSQTASQLAGYLTQIDTYRNVFSNLDMVMINPPEQSKITYFNKSAANGANLTFSPFQMPEQNPGIWVKPYSTFESVRLKNGPKVSNVSYGTIIGAESGLKELKNGWHRLYGAYISYNGSHQAFAGNDIYNNGGLFGLDAAFYRGKFFTVWTVDAGANASEASTNLGKENFAMFMTGIAQKTGYNIETFDRKLIIQPSLLTSYTFVNTFDYKGVHNVDINPRPINALQIEPEIKFIANCKKYLQPYLSVSMVWNLIDSAKFRADNVTLPDMSVKPFVQYGAGVQKRFGERVTGFFETLIRNGGRQGVVLRFGLRISI